MGKRWRSFEEFKDQVQPEFLVKGYFENSIAQSIPSREREFGTECDALEEHLQNFARLGIHDGMPKLPQLSPEIIGELAGLAVLAFHALETLVMLDKRLIVWHSVQKALYCRTGVGYYSEKGGRMRLPLELKELCLHLKHVVAEIKELSANDEVFLVSIVECLPPELKADFVTAKDLFSVGFDEYGLFATARGMERILRTINRDLKIYTADTDKTPEDQNFSNLLISLGKHRFPGTQVPLLNKDTRSLLEHVNQLRNACAHGRDDGNSLDETARENAKVIATAARDLWTRYQAMNR